MFNSRIPLKTLSILSRSLSTMLEAGVQIDKAVQIVAKKLGDAKCRGILNQVVISLQKGEEITAALKEHAPYFPDLFIDMVGVADSGVRTV